MGNRDYYLWVGLASTIDRQLIGVSPAQVQELAVLVDGRPMLLPLVNWATDLEQSPYDTAVPLYATFAAHASLDQIRRIATAKSVEVHLVSASGMTRRYQSGRATGRHGHCWWPPSEPGPAETGWIGRKSSTGSQ